MPKKVWHKVARKLLLVKVKLPKGSRPTFTEAHRLYGNCLVTTTKHVCALVNGELLDTHDCRVYDGTALGLSATQERKAMSVWVHPHDPHSSWATTLKGVRE